MNNKPICQEKDDFSKNEKRNAVEYLMFLKENQNSSTKERGCADRRLESKYMNQKEAACRHGARHTHATRRYHHQAHHMTLNKTIYKIYIEEQKRKTHHIFET